MKQKAGPLSIVVAAVVVVVFMVLLYRHFFPPLPPPDIANPNSMPAYAKQAHDFLRVSTEIRDQSLPAT